MTERNLYDALVAARSKMSDPRLTGDNPHFRSKFVPRDEVLEAVVKPLLAEGVFVTQGIEDGALVTTAYRGDEWLVLSRWPIAANADPQKYMAAVTYASRGSLMQAFALAGDADDDGNAAAKPEPKQPEPKPKPSAKLMSKAQKAGIVGLVKEMGMSNADAHALLVATTDREDAKTDNLTHDEAERIIERLTSLHAEYVEGRQQQVIADLGATEVK